MISVEINIYIERIERILFNNILFKYAGDVSTLGPGDFQDYLKIICIESKGERVKQEDILDILGISDDLSTKSRLSRSLTAIFPNCEKKRVLCKEKQMYPLTCL